ncbi:UNVERIFIED_CONTAM: hypothetical protein PYX00_006884 [Menopon gallinae]|uniref:CRAL-TRIO domain-containing protein n=1 Tax=Menopon gallinae TaxID=328185 RepID=A0AAW2HXQ4_9NEOP
MAKAERELRETPEVRKKALEDLRALLENEKNMYFADRDEILIRYLRPVKFYPESALALMKRIAEFKQKHASVVKDLMPVMMEDVMLNNKGINVLVDRDQDGRRILVAQVGKNWDTSKVSNVQVFQLFYLIHLAALVEPATQVNGVVVIMDFEGLGLKQIKELTPNFSLRLLSFIQDAMPLRLKEVHIVKQPRIFSMVWKIFKPLIKEKLDKRLHFHGNDMSSLHKFISPSCLPEDYDGKLPKIDYSAREWYPVLRSLDSTMEEYNKFGFTAPPAAAAR